MSAGDPEESITHMAADWLGRHDAGLSPAEEADFQEWLESDARHARAFHRLTEYSRALDRLAELRRYPGGLDVATDRPRRGAGARTLEPRRGPFVVWAMAAALALGAAIVWREWPASPFQEVAVTAVGEGRRLSLPDGSSVALNTDSHLAVDFTASSRTVELLRGEAHFVVAKETRRPFVVRVGGVSVRAVGTAFSVRRDAATVDVLVTEGLVRVDDSAAGQSLIAPVAAKTAEPSLLGAGHRVRVIGNDGTGAALLRVAEPPQPVAQAELARRLAWQERRLEFSPTPLGEVISEFNRYTARRLVLADAELAGLSVGGSFQAGDVETLVRLLESTFGIVGERRGQEILLRRGAGAPPPSAP